MHDEVRALLSAAAEERSAEQRQWLEALLHDGLPTTRQEAWKYTDLGALERQWQTSPTGAEMPASAVHDLPDAPLRLVVVDGVVDNSLSRLNHLPPDAVTESPVQAAADSMPARLAACFAPRRLNVRLPADVHVDEPLQIVVVANRSTAPVSAVQLDLALDGNARLEADLVLRGDGVHALALNADLAAGAHLALARDQACDATAFVLEHMQARIGPGAHLAQTHIDIGARLTRRESQLVLAGDDARLDYDVLTCLNQRQHVDHHIRILHEQPNGTSRINARALLGDTSRGVITGRVEVAPGAIGTDSAQMARSLLLSDAAEANVRPELEIYADDVKCAHGATIGQMDETALFYLRTRGLDPMEARALLMHSFAADIVNTVASERVRDRLTAQLGVRLRQFVGEAP